MTRQEAKQRWCPFGRVADGGFLVTAAVNRDGDGEDHFACTCIADGCMAWREFTTEPASGWCGMAGREGAP